MPAQNTLYDQIIAVSEPYLGPVSERFMRRQIETHLKISPEKITEEDIPKLIEWTRLAFAMISRDAKKNEAFMEQLLALSQTKRGL